MPVAGRELYVANIIADDWCGLSTNGPNGSAHETDMRKEGLKERRRE